MAAIFTASTDLGSTQHTSRIIAPILRYFWPTVSAQAIHDVQVVVRKIGHLSGYAVLGILVWRAWNRGMFRNWNLRAALVVESTCLLYAISDEFHQSFVPSREASPVDVLIDSAGAAVGLFIVWAIGKTRAKW
jgi:VanZ family protein